MATIDDNNALLLYRVGPVLCSSPCLTISAIIEPRTLTRPPGASSARPGIFKHANAIVSSLDLRYKFGVDEADWVVPGRTIVTQLDKGHVGFYVDEILDVISLPTSGWGQLPALLPRGIFSRTLLFKQHIYLYADFNDLQRIPDSGYLRTYIQQLLETDQRKQPAQAATFAINDSSPTTPNSLAKATQRQHTVPGNAVKQPSPVATVNASASVMQTAQTRHDVTAERKPAVTLPTSIKKATSPQPATHTGAATPSNFAAHAKPANMQRTTQADKSASFRSTPTHTRTTNIVTAQRAPVAQIRSPNTVTPISADKPPAVHTTTTREAGRPLAVLLMLVLLFGGSAIGLWYVLRDNTRHASNAVVTPITPDVTQLPVTKPTVITPPETAPVSTQRTLPPTPTAKQIDNANDDQPQAIPAHAAIPATKAAAPPPPQKEAAKPDANTDDYHASIEQDQHGLTIILDAPADDPVFTQPQATHNNATVIATTPAATETRIDTSSNTNTEVSNADASPNSESATTQTAAPQSVEIIHIVVKGDTLWDIAKRYVNNPFRYPELARLSKIKNPDLIYPGNRVRIIKRKHQP